MFSFASVPGSWIPSAVQPEICFMESVKTVKTNPISCDLFQMQHDGSGESHI